MLIHRDYVLVNVFFYNISVRDFFNLILLQLFYQFEKGVRLITASSKGDMIAVECYWKRSNPHKLRGKCKNRIE